MSTDTRPWEDAEDAAVALSLLAERDERARLISAVDGRWVLAEQNRQHETAAAAYAAALMESGIHAESTTGRGPFVAATVDGHVIVLQEQCLTRVTTGMRVASVDEIPTTPSAPGPAQRLLDDALRALGLTDVVPAISPLTLSDVADALQAALPSPSVRENKLLGGVRRRSCFPFHEAESFSSAGVLASADAVDAVRQVRADLETCEVIFAERWAQLIAIEMARETALSPDPSPTGGMAFSPAAHQLADWLQLAPAELAAGEGNLVILGRRFAHDSELVEVAVGELAAAHPVTEDPWFIWLFHDGVVQRLRLRTDSDRRSSAE